jgi:hypothetical protein
LAIVAVAVSIAVEPAAGETPSLQWEGVKQVVVLCQAAARPPHDADTVSRALCARTTVLAARRAPVPVKVVTSGDPSLRAANSVVLVLQASVVDLGAERLGLAIAARTDHRSTLNPDSSYLGAVPQLAPFTSATRPATWDAAVSRALEQLLPWLANDNGRVGRPVKGGDE